MSYDSKDIIKKVRQALYERTGVTWTVTSRGNDRDIQLMCETGAFKCVTPVLPLDDRDIDHIVAVYEAQL